MEVMVGEGCRVVGDMILEKQGRLATISFLSCLIAIPSSLNYIIPTGCLRLPSLFRLLRFFNDGSI